VARDDEAYAKYGHPDLTGTTLTLYGKYHKTRAVEINQRLADAIRERRKRGNSKALFVNRNGKPDKHLLHKLQNIAQKAAAAFHTDFTNCARLAQAGGTLPACRCRHSCSNWAMRH
jgi:integrase